MNERKYYPGFRRFLNSQLVDLDYLTERNSKANPWFYGLSFFISCSHFIKLTIQLILKEVNCLSYMIGDITFVAGPTQKQLALIYFAWYFACFMGTFNLLRSQYKPNLQKWIKIGYIFENLSSIKIHPYSGFPTYFHRYFIKFVMITYYSGGLGGFLLVVPSFFVYPQQFMIYIIIWCVITTIAGFVIIGNVANFGLLYGFQVCIYAKQINDEKIDLINRLEVEKVNSKKRLTWIVNHSIKSSTLKMKDQLNGSKFWNFNNESLFLAAFSAQSIILYLIFFVDLNGFLKVALIICGFLNWFCGFTVHFLLGSYGQCKVISSNHSGNLLLFIN